MKKTFLILGVIMVVVLAGCESLPVNQSVDTPEPANTNTAEAPVVDEPEAEEPVGIANPASENCVEKGGTIEMRENKKGQYGVCVFEDNRQCEEWALFRDQCPVGGVKITGYDSDAQIFCAITGGEVQDMDTDTPMCKRIDGTLCNAQSNLDGDCPDPNDSEPNAGNE